MNSQKNKNYHKGTKMTVKVIKKQETGPAKFNYFLKSPGYLVLVMLLVFSQAYLLSAFEAHVINVTAHICSPSETRTMGFWKNHCDDSYFQSPIYLGNLEITNCQEAIAVFKEASATEMADMLRGQLLAMKFNIACFGIEACQGENFDGLTLNEIVQLADNLLTDPGSTREDLEYAKNLLDDINNLHLIKYCSTRPAWFVEGPAKPDKPEKPDKEKENLEDELLADVAEPFNDEEEVCDADNLDLCDTQELCEDISLYWYNDVCNLEEESEGPAPEPEPEPEPEPICNIDHLDLCNTQELCEGISLYWYNDVCNLEEELTCDADHLDLCNTQELCEGISLFWYNDTCNPEEKPVDDDSPKETEEIPLETENQESE